MVYLDLERVQTIVRLVEILDKTSFFFQYAHQLT